MVNSLLCSGGEIANFAGCVLRRASLLFSPQKNTKKRHSPWLCRRADGYCYSRVMPACSQMRMVSGSQMPACTSPM